jgi:hypothetical protein
MAKRIGLSLSLCVKDIIDGIVAEDSVLCIVSNTSIKNTSDLRIVCNSYAGVWRLDPWSAFEITKRLYFSNRLIQPRIDDPMHCHSSVNHWIEVV